ncbi:MAG TPA: TIGR03435 family protein [Bryobacteraceae bacterium]|nr:TIGR03435 family protein [Bryobacteraceae bacterium]
MTYTHRAAILILLSTQAFSQQFEVASIKPNKTAVGENAPREKITSTPGTLIMQNVTLQTAIKWAYNLRDFQISGGPSWLTSERYDIAAKSPEGDQHQMLRSLLQDRFKLTAHLEKKDRPVYELVVARNGPKLHPSTKEGDPAFGPSGGELVFRNCSMADLADKLANRPFKLDLPVLDRTGLEGRYDFSLKLASNDNELKHTLEGMEQGPSIFIFFQDQLGLKLESRKAPLDVLVIESVQKIPTEN